MRNEELVGKWLLRARSNLMIAIEGKTSDDIFYEDLCFNAQQAVEKALIALFIYFDITIPKTHNIGFLLELLQNKTALVISQDIKRALSLTEYSVQSRYPGDYYPVEYEDYLEAVEIAGDILNWVTEIIDSKRIL